MKIKKLISMFAVACYASVVFAAQDKASGTYGYENSLDGATVAGGYGDYKTGPSVKPIALKSTGYVRIITAADVIEGECRTISVGNGWCVLIDDEMFVIYE